MISPNSIHKYITVSIIFLLATGFTAALTAQELTADELIAKNIEASGGTQAWAGIKSMKLTGTYTNFSDPESFVLLRARPDLYRFDCKRINQHTVHAYDGKKAWWVNPTMGPEHASPGYIPLGHNYEKVTLRDRFIDPVYWDYQKKGHQVELVGKTDLDGEEVYELKVTLKDESVENWFFSTETYLAVSMTGMTYDFGTPSPVETFFSDYRKVSGITLPFLIESEYSIRYRTYEIDEVLINPELDMTVFKLPTQAQWESLKK